MKKRIALLNQNNIKADLLFQIASEIEPYDGAINFLSELRRNYQIVILSDTFFNLTQPVFEKLQFPTVFCHELIVNDKQMVSGIKLCIENHKKLTIKAMNKLNFKTIAIGDSLNDIGMLEEANKGILFRSSNEIINPRRKAAIRPGNKIGNETRQKVINIPSPRSREASSR